MAIAWRVCAVGADPQWRARVALVLARQSVFRWSGGFEPAVLRARGGPEAALWLVDGDCAHSVRAVRHVTRAGGLYFYTQPDAAALTKTLLAGGIGCLSKRATADAVLCAVHAAGRGLFVAEARPLREAMMQTGIPGGDALADHDDHASLTARQREVARWAAQGLSNKQIARQLGISPETVKTHLRRACSREGVSGRVRLARVQPEERPGA